MNKCDFEKFHEKWLAAHALSSSNKEPDDLVVMAAFDLLSKYPMDFVGRAIEAHCKRSRFAPTPADIIDLLETNNKHLSADEAWALCPNNEFETVVWTREMAEAYSVCFDLLHEGDKVGARMAFKGAYERLINLSELQSKPLVWVVSIGSDKALIEPAVNNAAMLGRLSEKQALKYLPQDQSSGFIGKLLTGKSLNEDDKKSLKNIKKLKGIISNAGTESEAKKQMLDKSKKDQLDKNRQKAVLFCQEFNRRINAE